ncbi:MAG: PQQ-dependent sugar dehydrogenase, partial [Candidatus Limnocylindrales bacterium]
DEPTGPLDLRVELEIVAAGFESPVLLTGAGEGSADRFVVEQRGLVRRLGTDGVIDDEPFLDLRDRVLHHHERGLLGLAFHPEFADNGRFFVLYSQRAGDGATAISEFTVGDGAVDESERQLLTIPSFSTMHKGGMLAFDTEGMLLAGVGDGSTGNDPEGNGQDPASLLATLLRLDVDRGFPYAIPPDNGFADDREARGEVHAIGLRNPWRFSVDAETGHVYIGDVGQSDWEEIDVLVPGAREPSFGWSVMEGHDCFYGRDCDPADHIAPAIAYAHVDGDIGHCSVIGGYVYRGDAGTLPQDTYLYADFCSGTIWGARGAELRHGRAEPVTVGQVPAELGQPQSFGIDDEGELYLLTNSGYVLGISEAAPG